MISFARDSREPPARGARRPNGTRASCASSPGWPRSAGLDCFRALHGYARQESRAGPIRAGSRRVSPRPRVLLTRAAPAGGTRPPWLARGRPQRPLGARGGSCSPGPRMNGHYRGRRCLSRSGPTSCVRGATSASAASRPRSRVRAPRRGRGRLAQLRARSARRAPTTGIGRRAAGRQVRHEPPRRPQALARAADRARRRRRARVPLRPHARRQHASTPTGCIHLARRPRPPGRAEGAPVRAYFTEGEAIGDRDALVRLAVEAGLDADEARAVLAGDATPTRSAATSSRARGSASAASRSSCSAAATASPARRPRRHARGPREGLERDAGRGRLSP